MILKNLHYKEFTALPPNRQLEEAQAAIAEMTNPQTLPTDARRIHAFLQAILLHQPEGLAASAIASAISEWERPKIEASMR